MTEPTRPTIFALSSGRPPAAIAVIRISGSRAAAALKALGVKTPEPRKAGLARIRDPRTDEIIDEALALWFPAPHSETGEDVAELQLHGGRAVIAAVLEALAGIEGLKPAEAGEFTRRAFENGKLDLTAVEGLADLVGAETEGQRRQAFRQMKGLLGNRAETWRQRLIQALALVEARIDFSDEGDVPENLVQPALAIARSLADEIAGALADGGRGERLREGLVVAIAGPPNAGKSTLLNRLARRDAAIVSPYAGTTRDVIEVHFDLGGLPVTLLDTAGIRETDDPVELEGVRRARARAAAADLVLWVVDASGEPGVMPGSMADLAGAPTGHGQEPHGFAVTPGRPQRPGPESITPVSDYGFRARRDSASKTRVNALMAAPRNDGELTEGPEQAVVSEEPVSHPPHWLIRNKIDLLGQQPSKSESIYNSTNNSESTFRSNKPLKYIVSAELTARSEPKPRTNEPLTKMVNESLTNRNDRIFTNSDLEFTLSATSGEGFDLLLGQLARHAESFLAGAESALVTRQRHRHALEETVAALRRAQKAEPGGELAGREDLLAEELRIASRALGRLTGRVDVEDVLDVIFRDFCIGK